MCATAKSDARSARGKLAEPSFVELEANSAPDGHSVVLLARHGMPYVSFKGKVFRSGGAFSVFVFHDCLWSLASKALPYSAVG